MDRLRHFIRHGKSAPAPPARSVVPDAGTAWAAAGNSGPEAPREAAVPTTAPTFAGVQVAPAFYSPSDMPAHAPRAKTPLDVNTPLDDDTPLGGVAAPNKCASAAYQQQAERLVAEQREQRSKLPHYEGLPEQYTLLSRLGDGTFSVVYHAIDNVTGKKVAIKIVRKRGHTEAPGTRTDKTIRDENRGTDRTAILQEVQIMRRLQHSSIVQLLAFTESEDHCFLVMELLDGGELFDQIVKLTYLTEPLARHVILQVAEGIRFMHEHGIVHRDIKPENLLFEAIEHAPSSDAPSRPYDEDKLDEGPFLHGTGGGGIGRVKIADFGLSKVVWEESTKTPCGTVGYAAPEIVRDEHYSKSVDMWALGCVLYTLLCGFPPFYDESINQLTEKVSQGQYTFLSPWWDEISVSAKDLVGHLLCVDVEKRYTIEQFLAHEWCRADVATNPVPIPTRKPWRDLYARPDVDSPLLASLHAGDMGAERKADANRLREAFDVSFAVHRVEEEMRNHMRLSPRPGVRTGAWAPFTDVARDVHGEADAAARRHGRAAANAILERRARHKEDRTAPPASAPVSFNLRLEGASILQRRERALGTTHSEDTELVEPESILPMSGVLA
ncbi:MAPK-activated protein kinase Srk1 [Malassezia sp. CBS 17886]|nr:MAPK-activated protein kinase Srk1 [Malassezia sp. CBS 17886]